MWAVHTAALQKGAAHVPANLSSKRFMEALKERRDGMVAEAARQRAFRDRNEGILKGLGFEATRKRPNLGPLLLEHAALQESERKREEELEHGEWEMPVPIATAVQLDSEMQRTEEKVDSRDGATIVAGCVYLNTITTGAQGPQAGSSIFAQPLSPTFFGGSRLTAFANLFDLWRARRLVFEWVPLCPTTETGAVVGYCEPDVMGDPLCVTAPGAANVRDAMARPGAESNSLYVRTAYGINFPQQAWYYTANNDVPNLSIAGVFNLLCVSGLNATTSFGMLLCHYEIEFMQATQTQVSSSIANYYPSSTVALFTGVSLVTNAAFFTTYANFAPATLVQGTIGVGTVVSYNDQTTNQNWRSLTFGDAKKAVTVTVGTRLWFRLDVSGANVIFYPSLGGVIGGANPGAASQWGDCFYNTASNAAAAGTSLTFDELEIFQLPVY